ncbi:hypothetical protein ACB098_02G051700 [Castanea mollissima]
MFSISTCNLKNLIFLNHETFMLASSSDSSYKACMRVCKRVLKKIQNAIPKPKFLSQAINFMINSSREREREREEPGKERNELVSMSRERFLEPVSHIFASQSFESERKLKKKEENQREKARESGNEEWW